MARSKKTMTGVMFGIEYPKSQSPGRTPLDRVYDEALTESFTTAQAGAIPYDGSPEEFDRIRKDLSRGSTALGYGLRAPISMEYDGTPVVVFQAVPRRTYTDNGTTVLNCGHEVKIKKNGEPRKHTCVSE